MTSFKSETSTEEQDNLWGEFPFGGCNGSGSDYVEIFLDEEPEPTFEETIKDVIEWLDARHIIEGSTSKDQMMKLIQEVGEVSECICKDNVEELEKEIGDSLVTLISISEQNNLTLDSCLKAAYNKIKHRTGVMYEGVYVKSSDKEYEDILVKLGRV